MGFNYDCNSTWKRTHRKWKKREEKRSLDITVWAPASHTLGQLMSWCDGPLQIGCVWIQNLTWEKFYLSLIFSPPLNLFEVVKTASICFCCFCLPEWFNLVPTHQNIPLIDMEVQKPWREIHAWCESIWTEPSLPLCAAVPSHFKVHTSLFPARLFLYETERVHPRWFICFRTSLCACLYPQIKPRNIVAN